MQDFTIKKAKMRENFIKKLFTNHVAAPQTDAATLLVAGNHRFKPINQSTIQPFA